MGFTDWLKKLGQPVVKSAPTTSVPVFTPPRARPKPVIDPGRPTGTRIVNLRGDNLEEFDGAPTADIRIDLADNPRLKTLPDGIKTGTLDLSGCVSLERLPARIDVAFLDLEGCTALRALPDDLTLRGGRLNLRNCPMLTRLPEKLGPVSQLDLSGCLNITQIPATSEVTSWIDIGSSGVTSLPPSLSDVGIRWNGITIDQTIAFAPHTLNPRDILNERNTELRRVMLERYGYGKFFDAVDAKVLDTDTDPGGERRLLSVELEGDEPLVCVSVKCPSTGHQFVLRVPPTMRTCHQAVAWTAGYDDPKLYKPALET